jgi:hypothetical protein
MDVRVLCTRARVRGESTNTYGMESETLANPRVLIADLTPAPQTVRRVESVDVVRGSSWSSWLIVPGVVVLRCLGFQFNFDYRVTALTVLWALGWSTKWVPQWVPDLRTNRANHREVIGSMIAGVGLEPTTPAL